ncbi:MAG: Nif3-like dinuclear metal center hexameric protein [Mycoplasmataceae bacterium]|nr:Nif3-like dinuclear metal center hexameric protein [Mycoplasmataceae bacterium]
MKINNQKELINLIEKEFPLASQESWDFGGFSFISKKQEIKKVLICLDIDKKVILKAIKDDVDLILSHHPFCFASTKEEAIKIDSSKEELFNLVESNNISTYSLHTSFDSNIKGTDYYLLKKLNLLDNIVKRYKFNSVVNYSLSFKSLVDLIKEKTSSNYFISNWNDHHNKIIKNVYFAPGAGDVYEFMKHNKELNCDLLVTSDMKWNEQLVLENLGLKFLIISHQIEEVFIDGMNDFFAEKEVDNIEIILEYKETFLIKF